MLKPFENHLPHYKIHNYHYAIDSFNMMNWAVENENHEIIAELIKFGVVNATTELISAIKQHHETPRVDIDLKFWHR